MLSQSHLKTFNRPYRPTERDPDYIAPSYPLTQLPPINKSPPMSGYSTVQMKPRLKQLNNSASFPNINSFTVNKSFGGNPFAQQGSTLGNISTSRIPFKSDRPKPKLSPEPELNTIFEDVGQPPEPYLTQRNRKTPIPEQKSRLTPTMRTTIGDHNSYSRTVNSIISPRVGYGGVEKPHLDLNPIYTSKNFKENNLRAQPPPTDRIRSIFSIYYFGYGYDSASKSYGRPHGLGFIINDILAMTTHSVLPDEDAAMHSYAQFKDGEVFRFDPYLAFVSSAKFEFTIVAFQQHTALTVLRYMKPIYINNPCELRGEEQVYFLPHDIYTTRKVLLVEKMIFTFSSGKKEAILPGTPVFNTDWVMQGMFIRASAQINVAIRMEPVLAYLDQNLQLLHNPFIDKFLHADHVGYLEKFHNRFLYYFEWHAKGIWRYDIDRQEWSSVVIRNEQNFTDEYEDWTFHWNSRLVYLPDGSIMLLGGRDRKTGNETDDVMVFQPQRYHTIAKMTPMLERREGATCIYLDNYVYVFGGKPKISSNERFSLASKKWMPLSPMYYGRYDSACCSALDSKFIYIFGGQPLNLAGSSIERYNIEFDHWELLTVTLPRPLYRHLVFPVNNRRIAILGGNASHWVFVLQMEDIVEQGGVATSSVYGFQQFYRISDVMRPLDEIVETAYPPALNRSDNKLYIMNMGRAGYTQRTPAVIAYPVEYIDFVSDYSAKPQEVVTD